MIHHFIRFKTALIFLLFFQASYSYSSANQTLKAPFMWQIKTDKTQLYLAGSIHALNSDFYPLAPAYIQAFDSVDQLAVEYNILDLSPEKAQEQISQFTWLNHDESIESAFSQQEIEALKPFAERKGMNIDTLLRLRPWLIIEALSSFQFSQTDFQADLGVDMFFLKRANQQGKNILELETLQEQINAINGAELSAQTAAISLALSQLDKGQEQLTEMANYWQSADADGLYEYSQLDLIEQPNIAPLMSHLLYKRNQKMAERIQGYLEQGGSYFVMVGALHLSGPQSVQSYLEDMGYQATKVTP
jgi:uncharacterized protein YbaP (TraB family)